MKASKIKEIRTYAKIVLALSYAGVVISITVPLSNIVTAICAFSLGILQVTDVVLFIVLSKELDISGDSSKYIIIRKIRTYMRVVVSLAFAGVFISAITPFSAIILRVCILVVGILQIIDVIISVVILREIDFTSDGPSFALNTPARFILGLFLGSSFIIGILLIIGFLSLFLSSL